MKDEAALGRFYGLVITFILSIFYLIISPNYLRIFLGWDGLGITRFLLVVYYQNQSRANGGFLTILTNRLGDALLLTAIGLISWIGTWYVQITWRFESPDPTTLLPFASLEYLAIRLLLMAAWTKSAQTPFNAWLPAAIAAPTPVSTLVHSRTLVTAGIYLIIRFYPLWSQWPAANLRVTGAGLRTLAFGARIASTEQDVKKTIAYSTLRQLGFMVAILGLGFPVICFLHLLTHAFFKATLFMAAGVVFINRSHYQGFRNWHSRSTLPLAGVGLMLSLLAINAAFFLRGFYSKELILDRARFTWLRQESSYLPRLVLLGGRALTAIYSARLWRGLFRSTPAVKSYSHQHKRHHLTCKRTNPIKGLQAPLLAICGGVTTVGVVLCWAFIFPTDHLILSREWGKISILLVSIGGIFGALIPCKEGTKLRSFQESYRAGLNRKYLTSLDTHNHKPPANLNRKGAHSLWSVLTHSAPHWIMATKIITWADLTLIFDQALLSTYSALGRIELSLTLSSRVVKLSPAPLRALFGLSLLALLLCL